jgi:hypothetical protein
MMLAEPYDGTWSGLSGGFALGMVAVLAFTLALVIFGMTGGAGGLATTIGESLWMWVGIAAAVVIVPALVGMFVGRKS